MPLYTYICVICGAEQDNYRSVRNRNCKPHCERGHEKEEMARKVTAAMLAPDYPPYNCPVTGALISGRKAHEENLKKHGARVLEPGETAAHERRRAKEDADLDRRIGETVDQAIAEMPADKRAQLATEVSLGADVNVTRATGKAPQ